MSVEHLETLAREAKMDGRFADALRNRLAMKEHFERHGGSVKAVTNNLNMIAFLAIQLEETNLAENSARECLCLYAKSISTPDERLATYYTMLSCVLAECKNFEEAVLYGEQGVPIFRTLFGADDCFVREWEDKIDCMRRKEPRLYLERT